MSEKKSCERVKAPPHFYEHLGRIRQWICGFQAAGKEGPVNADTLRQIQLWLKEHAS
jgi:hypothetical protein